MNILIPNATSPKNPGDQAMLAVLIGLVRTAYPNISITVHSTDPHLYSNVHFKIKHTLYSWSVFKNRKLLPRLLNVSILLMQYIFLRVGITNLSINKNLAHLIGDYENADLILFVGGGYLRSKKGIKQSLNLWMHLLLFKYAALFKARKIVGPISVGPFGYRWQESAAIRELKRMDKVAIREYVSYSIVKKYKLKNIIRSSDHAFMVQQKQKTAKKSSSKIILGFTIRQWLKGKKQSNLEASVVWAIENFVLLTGATIQPIIQVDASEYGEDDVIVTKAITKKLINRQVEVLPIKKIRSAKDASRVYADLDLLLGMRMHSNIFAANQGIPFVAISYEHKTEGIAKELSMGKYCISCEKIDGKSLYDLLVDVFTNRKYLSRQLIRSLKNIQKTETMQWGKYLAIS